MPRGPAPSKRTVYNHFPSKEVLFAEILHQLWDASFAGEALAFRADQPLRDQLLELIGQKLRLLNDEAFVSLARVAIAAGIHSPERTQAMVARMGEREEGLTVWIRDAAAAGRLKIPDPVFASHQLQRAGEGFCVLATNHAWAASTQTLPRNDRWPNRRATCFLRTTRDNQNAVMHRTRTDVPRMNKPVMNALHK